MSTLKMLIVNSSWKDKIVSLDKAQQLLHDSPHLLLKNKQKKKLHSSNKYWN